MRCSPLFLSCRSSWYLYVLQADLHNVQRTTWSPWQLITSASACCCSWWLDVRMSSVAHVQDSRERHAQWRFATWRRSLPAAASQFSLFLFHRQRHHHHHLYINLYHATANDRQQTEYTKSTHEHTANETTKIRQTGIQKLHATIHNNTDECPNNQLIVTSKQQKVRK